VNRFVRAVELMLACERSRGGHGHGQKRSYRAQDAATLASTGTPAMFVHPAEASHGDLGMIKSVDLVLAISNSGESEELIGILPLLKRLGAPLLA
jgi:arabinose-5-phosphate isomerase